MNSGEAMEHESRTNQLGVWSFLILTAALLAAARSVHYLLFHTLAELVAITVSFSVFTLTWTSQKYLRNSYLTILGAAFGTIGIIDVFHTLTFRGMNLFPMVTTNHPTQLWLTARFIEAIALVAAPLLIRRTVRFGMATLVFALLGTAGCIAVWIGALPQTFVDGVGLTPFKITSEYVIVCMLLVGLLLLWRVRQEFSTYVFSLVSGSLIFAVATEICFIHYVTFYDFINELGHLFRFLSVVLVYLAIVVTGVRTPAELLFRQIVEKERELANTNMRLAESEDRLNKAQAVSGVGSWLLDIASGQLTMSDEAYRIFGLPPGTPLTLEAFVSCLHPDDREAVLAAWSAALTGSPYDIEHRVVADGQTKWVHELAEVRFSPEGLALAGLGTVQDVTNRKVAEEARRESEDRFRNTLEHAPIGMALVSPDGKFIQVNQAFCYIVGYDSEELLRLTFEAITHPDDIAKDISFVRRMEAGEIPSYEIEKRYLHKDGRIVWVQITGSILRDEKGEPLQIIKQVQDITERKELAQRLERQAHTDFLTGLANRGHFLELAAQELARARRYRSPLSMAMLDLDHFKVINDTYGHGVGDRVLIELANICRRTLRGPDVIGRMGGEEFAILFPETAGDQAYEVTERLREIIASTEIPIEHGLPVHFSASMGITSIASSDTNIDVLLNRADQALYAAKRNGRNRVVIGRLS